MYGKLFTQMYDGTLATKGPWQALVTFQQLIILSDKHGVVDMTPEAISRRTTIPLEIITAGLSELQEDDLDSRTPIENGKRIVRLSENRAWGWQIVNYAHYRKIRSAEERKEYHAKYVKKWRETKVNKCDDVNPKQPIAVSSMQYAEERTTLSGKPDVAKRVLDFLNSKTQRRYQPVKANLEMIEARLKDGATEQELMQVVAKKCREWAGDEKMSLYLRPATLFNRTKFAQYQGELLTQPEAQHAMP